MNVRVLSIRSRFKMISICPNALLPNRIGLAPIAHLASPAGFIAPRKPELSFHVRQRRSAETLALLAEVREGLGEAFHVDCELRRRAVDRKDCDFGRGGGAEALDHHIVQRQDQFAMIGLAKRIDELPCLFFPDFDLDPGLNQHSRRDGEHGFELAVLAAEHPGEDDALRAVLVGLRDPEDSRALLLSPALVGQRAGHGPVVVDNGLGAADLGGLGRSCRRAGRAGRQRARAQGRAPSGRTTTEDLSQTALRANP